MDNFGELDSNFVPAKSQTYSIGSLLTSIWTVSHIFDHARGASEEMMEVSADGSSTVHAVSMRTI